MDHLKEGIGLRGYAQQDPLVRLQEGVFRDVRRHDDALPGRHRTPPLPHADHRSRRQPDRIRRAARSSPGTRPGPRAGPTSPTASLRQRTKRPAPIRPTATHHAPAARQNPPAPPSNRAPSTTIDALEREFQKKKQRELEQARSVSSSSSAANGSGPRHAGEKVGRNDDAPAAPARSTKSATAPPPKAAAVSAAANRGAMHRWDVGLNHPNHVCLSWPKSRRVGAAPIDASPLSVC